LITTTKTLPLLAKSRGNLDEEPTVVVVVTGRCEIRRTEVIALAHLVAVLLVIATVVILVLVIAVW